MFAEYLDNINYNNIIICDPIKNSVIDNSSFYKIIYSNDYISFNGIFCLFNINNISINKDKIFFNKDDNYYVINKLIKMEEYITNLCQKPKNKNIIYKLKELLNNNCIKFVHNDDNNKFNNNNLELFKNNSNNSNNFILKISGLWQTKENIGMTFKIIKVDKYLSIC